MGFGHSHTHGHSHDHEGSGDSKRLDSDGHRKALLRALAITLFFAVVEVVGGFFANSLALISDSIHMLADAGALVFSLAVIWVSKRKATQEYTYGYQRLEILGALMSGLMIWLLTGFLVYESISRFREPQDVNGVWVFWIALIGLAANLSSLYFLHRSSKENLNVRSAYLHVVTDSIGSVGALIAGVVISLTGYRLIDPMITIFLSALMLWSSWSLVREAVEVLMERSPGHLRLESIEGVLRELEGVREIHDLHVWTLSSGQIALSVHLIGEGERVGSGEILHAAAHRLEEDFGITHTTIQVEPLGSESAEHCTHC